MELCGRSNPDIFKSNDITNSDIVFSLYHVNIQYGHCTKSKCYRFSCCQLALPDDACSVDNSHRGVLNTRMNPDTRGRGNSIWIPVRYVWTGPHREVGQIIANKEKKTSHTLVSWSYRELNILHITSSCWPLKVHHRISARLVDRLNGQVLLCIFLWSSETSTPVVLSKRQGKIFSNNKKERENAQFTVYAFVGSISIWSQFEYKKHSK